MSDAPTAEPRGESARLREEGVTLELHRCRPTDDVAAFAYELRTDRAESVSVRVHQPLPDGLGADEVGYPADSEDRWTLTSSGLVLEVTLEPDRPSVRAVWGVHRPEHPAIQRPDVVVAPRDDGPASPTDAAGLDRSTPFASTPDAGATPSTAAGDASAAGTTATGADGELESDGASSELTADSLPAGGPTPAVLDLDGSAAEDDPTVGTNRVAGTDPAAEGDSAADEVSADSGASSTSLAPADPDDVAATDVTLDLEDGGNDGAGSDDPSGRSSATADVGDDEHGDDEAATSGEPLVARLAEELAAEDLDDDHQRALRDALEFRLSDATNAYVEHLQGKLDRRTDRIEADLESLEEGVEQLYGVAAEVQDVETLKRGITELDDTKAGRADLEAVDAAVGEVADHADVIERDLDALRGDHGTLVDRHERLVEEHEGLAGRAATTDDLDDLTAEVTTLEERSATDDRVDGLAEDLADLEKRAVATERVDDLAAVLEDHRETAATEEDLDALRETVEALRDAAATTDGLEARADALGDRIDDVAEAADDLADRHVDLASDAATEERLEAITERHRSRLREVQSTVAGLEATLEDEYVEAEAVDAELNARFHRSAGALALFGIGTTGLLSTIPLAASGSIAAAVTFAGGALALGAWWSLLGGEDLLGSDVGIGG